MIVHLIIIFFFIFTGIGFYALVKNQSYKWIALLVPSLIIYCYYIKWLFLIVLLITIFVYFASIYLDNKRKILNKLSYYFVVFVTLLPLFFFKINETLNVKWLTDASFLGLSFVTFNALSYLIDIKKGYLQPEKNILLLLLFICFYPHILAGPLHKVKYLLPQFMQICITPNNISLGCRLILWGIFKKYAIAQNLAITVSSIIDKPESHCNINLLVGGTIFFFQIYCDFSAYVDIMKGVAKIFNIDIKTNFKDRIYLANSRLAFWSGWHVTLNNWFRDYVFYAIAKNYKKQWQLDIVTIFTFVLIGLWHGFTISFIIWGLINGVWFVFEKYLKVYFDFLPNTIRNYLGIIYHITLASFVALLFRSKSISLTISNLFNFQSLKFDKIEISSGAILSFILMDLFYMYAKGKPIEEFIGQMSVTKRWGVYFILSFSIITWQIGKSDFYYFKF